VKLLQEIAATMVFSATQNNDKLDLSFIFRSNLYIPPKKENRTYFRIIRELIEFKPKSNNRLIQALKWSVMQKKKAIVF
jgi:uncharacterized protein (DUF58 family)